MDLQRGNPNVCLGLPQELFDDILYRATETWPESASSNKDMFALSKVDRSFNVSSIAYLNTEWEFNNGTLDSLINYLETRLQNNELPHLVQNCRINWAETIRRLPTRLPRDFTSRLRSILRDHGGTNKQDPLHQTLTALTRNTRTFFAEQNLLNLVFCILPSIESLEFMCAPKVRGTGFAWFYNRRNAGQRLKLTLAPNLQELTFGVDTDAYTQPFISLSILSDVFTSAKLKKLNILGAIGTTHRVRVINNSVEELVLVDSHPGMDLKALLSHFQGLKALALHQTEGHMVYNPSWVAPLRQLADKLEVLHLHQYPFQVEFFGEFTCLTALSFVMKIFVGDRLLYLGIRPLSAELPATLVSLRLYTEYEDLYEGGFDYLSGYLQDMKEGIAPQKSLKDIFLVIDDEAARDGIVPPPSLEEAFIGELMKLSDDAISVNIKLTWFIQYSELRTRVVLPDFAGKAWGYQFGLIKPFEEVISMQQAQR